MPVYRLLIGDALTPVSAFCKIQEGEWAFLFESVVGGERLGRYSFLGAGPFLRFQAFGHRVVLQPASRLGRRDCEHPDPLRLLEEKLTAYRAPHVAGLPRFCGGAVGYAGYDAVRYVEKLPNPPPDDRRLARPLFCLLRSHGHLRSHQQNHRRRGPCATSIRRICAGSLSDGLRSCGPAGRAAATRRGRLAVDRYGAARRSESAVSLQFRAGEFEAAVAKCKEYIKAGDIFQVVLSQRLQTETQARPFDIYRTLRVVNPSPFMFYVKADGRFVSWAVRRKSWCAWKAIR